MSELILPAERTVSASRRRFVKGLAAGGAMLGLGLTPQLSQSASNKSSIAPQLLRGTRFDLTYTPLPVNFTGKERYATAINGSVPAPTLRWREGDTITLKVTNHLAEDTSIHWHGLILPSSQDGVPFVSENFKGIKPGETFTYRFPLKQSGTYWYHSHSGFQEPTGAYGAIIIDPKEPDPVSFDRDYVVLLSDWSDEDPSTIYHKLKKSSDYYNFRQRTLSDAFDDITELGWRKFWQQRGMWNESRMSDRDISDVTGYTYTYLMNGATPAEGWLGLFKKGEKVRLRFINGSSMTFFDVRIPGLKMTVVAADGQNIEPVTVEEFGFGVGETYDVIVEPEDDRAYTLFAQSIDRSGYALGTLTPDPALKAEIPQMDEAPILKHTDMGMNMAGMKHSDHNMAAM
ncbi:MAG: copper resistance system multicopper oxidase, partial [Methylococcaceae bacterium]|nr:copper resistance system multicopper oxidase [Methylococcaceae bacterium]